MFHLESEKTYSRNGDNSQNTLSFMFKAPRFTLIKRVKEWLREGILTCAQVLFFPSQPMRLYFSFSFKIKIPSGEVPWTVKRSNQSILKEINLEYSLEGLLLKLQYFGHLTWTADSLEKTLMMGKTEGRRKGDDEGWDGWMASPTWWTWVWVSSGSWWWTGKSGVLQSMGSQRVGHNWVTEQEQ